MLSKLYHAERGRVYPVPIELAFRYFQNLDIMNVASGANYAEIIKIDDRTFIGKIKKGPMKKLIQKIVIQIVAVNKIDYIIKYIVKLKIKFFIWKFIEIGTAEVKFYRVSDNETSIISVVESEVSGFFKNILYSIFWYKLENLLNLAADEVNKALGTIYNNPGKYGISLSREFLKAPIVEFEIIQSGDTYILDYKEYDKELIVPTVSIKPMVTVDPHKKLDILKKLRVLLASPIALSCEDCRGNLNSFGNKLDEHYKTLVNICSTISTLFVPKEIIKKIYVKKPQYIIIKSNDYEIPWELIYDGKSFLCLDNYVSRMVVVQKPLIIRHKRKTHFDKLNILMIVNPTNDLPYAKAELNLPQIIKEYCNCDILTKRDASLENFISLISKGNYDILHFSGHIEYNSKSPEKSVMFFSDCELFATEVGRILESIDEPPRFTFLNACSSGKIEKFLPIREGGSIAYEFLKSGTDTFLGTLAPVSDKSAGIFSKELYKHLSSGLSIGTAVTLARRTLFEMYGCRDMSWSFYILYGDPTLRLLY